MSVSYAFRKENRRFTPKSDYPDEVVVEALTAAGAGATQVIEHLYRTVRPLLTRHVVSGPTAEEDSWDILQDGLLVLIQNLREGKFNHSSQLKTYLVGICRNIWRERLKKRGTAERKSQELRAAAGTGDQSVLPRMLDKEKRETVRALCQQLPSSCGAILRMFYWEGFDMESIALRLGYENEGSVRSRKYKCQRDLMEILRKRPDIANILME